MASTLLVTSENSNRVNERKVRGSLKHKKGRASVWLVGGLFALYFWAYLACWLGFEFVVDRHQRLSRNVFDLAASLALLHFSLADAAASYFELMSLEQGWRLLPAAELAEIESSMPSMNLSEYLRNRTNQNIDKSLSNFDYIYQSISNIQTFNMPEVASILLCSLTDCEIGTSKWTIEVRPNIRKMRNLQAIQYLINSLSDSLNITDTLNSPLSPSMIDDLTKFRDASDDEIATNGIQTILPHLLTILRLLITNIEAKMNAQYSNNFLFLVILAGSTIILCFASLMCLAVIFHRDLKQVFSSFNLLMPEDLMRELNKISKARNLLGRDLFEDKERMDEAFKLTR